MISKITKGESFRGLLNYLFSKPGAELIGGNILGETAYDLAIQFEESSIKSARVQKPVGHFSLSVPSTDKLDEVDWLDIASNYMKKMGYDCNKYAVVHHTDRDHDHIHIAACRVREDTGRCVEDSWDYRKSEAIVKKLEVDYNLTPSPNSQDKDRRSPTTGERRLLARTGEDSVRVKLQDTIDELCSQQPTMPKLIDLLKDQGIDVRISEMETGSMGISYELDGVAFKGSQLGKAYSFNGLQKHRSVEYDPERDDSALAKLTEGIAAAYSRPPVMTSQNSTTTDSTNGSDDDDNETIGASSPSNQKVESPGQLPSIPELELEAGNNEAATVSSDKTEEGDDDEKLNYQDIFAAPKDFDALFIENRVRERIERVNAKLAAEQAQRIERYLESYEALKLENTGEEAPDQLHPQDAIPKVRFANAPEYASNLNHQTAQTDPTVPTELDQDDDEVINVDPIEENWEPLRSHLIEQYCLPPSLLDALHSTERLYANVDGMAVFSLRTLDNIETGVWVLNPSTEDDTWVDLNLEPDVEEEVNGEPAFFWISSLGDAPNDKAIITSDPIETISYVALDPSFEQNNTIYISAFDVDSLPIKSLQQLKSNVVVSFKGDSEGKELESEVTIALPKSQKVELDEAGWNGMLKEHERSEARRSRSQQAEQMQLLAQYQSQQESQMEL